jgi:hypothetical protein
MFSANPAAVSEGGICTMDMNDISEYIRASKDVLDILKTLGGLLPKGPDSDAAKQRLEQAEKALRASEAQLAKALGYQLCQCTFPPQIMLSKGRHPVHDTNEIFECPNCGKKEPPESKFQALDQMRSGPRRPIWSESRRGR